MIKKLILLLLFLPLFCFCQIKSVPKNLKQAVSYLNVDMSDSLKSVVKRTHNDSLKELSYPWGKYRTIFNWLDESKNESRLKKYFNNKGINKDIEAIILISFKRFLNKQEFDEDKILNPYIHIEKMLASEDEMRYVTDSIDGIYIPINLEDSFEQINQMIPDSTKITFKEMSEDSLNGNLHMSFGRWMRNNWGLWSGSRLSKFFNEIEIYHPDDMSGIILTSYHRMLNNKDVKLNEQVEYYKSYWADAKEKSIKEEKQKFSLYKLDSIIYFKYKYGFSSQNQENSYNDEICIAKGKITAIDANNYMIKVKLIEACDKKGIIYDDNVDYLIYDPKLEKYIKPKKRVIKYMKENKEEWFRYDSWSVHE